MSANVRIKKLEALLGKINENSARPRALAAAPVVSLARAPAAAPVLELDEPTLEEPPDSLDGDLALQSPARVAAAAEVDELDLDVPVHEDDVELDEVELEEPPESGSGLVADPIGRAIAEEDNAGPLTPPPESGPEPAKAPAIPVHGGPTMEQLGQTIHLEEGPDAGALEVDEPIEEELAPPPKSHLEVELPTSAVGTFDQRLSSPPEARAELERVRLGQPAEVLAHVAERPVISTNVVDFVGAHAAVPETFLAWLDSSLEL